MPLPIYMVSNRYKALTTTTTNHNGNIKYGNIKDILTPTLLENYIISNTSTNDIQSNYLSFLDGLNRLCCTNSINESQLNHIVDHICSNVIPSLNSNQLSSFYTKLRQGSIPVKAMSVLESSIDSVIACDRVINNDDKLSKRFNIDKIASSNKEIKQIVREICELIDTYNIKESVKMNVALENICYSLYKNKKYNQPIIVSEIVDYFLTREPVIPDYKYKGYQNIIKKNIFLNESSVRTVEKILDEDHIYFIDMIHTLKSLTENKDIHNAIDLIPKINTEDRASQYINALAELYEDCYDTDRMIITNILNGLPLFTNICHDFINTYMDILNDRYLLKGEFIQDSSLMKQASILESIYKKIKQPDPSSDSNKSLLESFLYDQNKDINKFNNIIDHMDSNEKIQSFPTIIRYKGRIYNEYVENNDLIHFIENTISDCTTTYQIDQIDNILKPISDKLPPEVEKFCLNTLPMYRDAIDVDSSDRDDNLEDIIYGMKVCEVFDKSIKESKETVINTINTIIPYIISDSETINEFMSIVAMCPHIISLEEITKMNQDVPQNVIESTNLKNATVYSINENTLFINEADTVYDLNIELEAVSFLLTLNEDNIIDKAKNTGTNAINKIKNTGKDLVNKTKDSVKNIEKDGIKGFSMYKFKLAMKSFWSKMKKLSVKEKQFCQNLDATTSKLYQSIKNSMTTDRREALIKGEIVPSFSKCVKNAIALAGVIGVGSALAGGLSALPVVAPITLLGAFATNKRLNDKEKLMLYDELDTELQVIEKEIAIAENEQDMNKYRFLLNYQKRLIREKQRIKYNLKPKDGNMSRKLH